VLVLRSRDELQCRVGVIDDILNASLCFMVEIFDFVCLRSRQSVLDLEE
jgi:hypothetical protein